MTTAENHFVSCIAQRQKGAMSLFFTIALLSVSTALPEFTILSILLTLVAWDFSKPVKVFLTCGKPLKESLRERNRVHAGQLP